MKFENCKVFNMEGALRGMRNPKNSWHLSDSEFGMYNEEDAYDCIDEVAEHWAEYDGHEWGTDDYDKYFDEYGKWLENNCFLSENRDIVDIACIGPKDMKLAKQLIAGGSEHRKFLRQIVVSIDITAPLYWWKEFDTYKVATVANSTSTMHKLTSKPIIIDCFETGDFENIPYPKDAQRPELKSDIDEDFVQMGLIPYLEYLRQKYLELVQDNPTEAKKYWKELVRWLPNGWLQTRTWTANYETLRSMYRQRKDHKLTEWHQFCNFVKTLPYAKEFIID